MGKREIVQLGTTDLIVSILIAELVAISIENFFNSLLSILLALLCYIFCLPSSRLSL